MDYPLLFIHAQDILMRLQSEINMASHMIELAQAILNAKIEAEVSGEQMDYPLLFIHAQDILMRLQSEINMASHMIELAQAILNAKASDQSKVDN